MKKNKTESTMTQELFEKIKRESEGYGKSLVVAQALKIAELENYKKNSH